MPDRSSDRYDLWAVNELLRKYEGLRIRPHGGTSLRIEGELDFRMAPPQREDIADTYRIAIDVPLRFPAEIPTVRSLDDRVPKDFHTNPDGTFCLGSPLQLHLILHECSRLTSFVDRCVVPFLYGRTYFKRHAEMPFEELRHGRKGILDDYARTLRVRSSEAAIQMVALMAIKKNLANKKPCPCGSGQRVGKCHNRLLNPLRKRLGRSWFRREYANLIKMA
ncbi:MAG: hypothetical protein GC159_20655 [Phycisphaera sp.]|nr:hypothetical protein [Phycisphaera sp.]